MGNSDKFNKEGLRSFYNEATGKTYYIISPTAEHIRNADWEYSKAYTKSLVAGITTTAEMTDILMRRGIIGPEFEQRSEELATELAKKIELLENAKTPEEKSELATEVALAREELFQWNQRLNAPLANTCEQISDDARLEYLTSCLVVDENGNNVWGSYDEYLTEKTQSLSQQARFEVMLFLQGLDSDFLDQTPEARAMKELEQSAVEELLNVEEFQEDNNKVEEDIQKKVSKRRAPKKTTRKVAKKPLSKK